MKFHIPVLMVFLILQGCLKINQSSTDTEKDNANEQISLSSIAGVAATGAPIIGGEVKIQDARGKVVTSLTAEDGSYSADVSELDPPLLVLVTAPTGEKVLSVAPESALVNGKKINLTPLTSIVAANVFANANIESVFDNFVSHATHFEEEALENQRKALAEKLEASGLLSAGKFRGEEVDLLNGPLLAGTSLGIDGLLDLLEVSLDTVFIVKIKGTNTTITDDPSKLDEPAEDCLSGGRVDSLFINSQIEVLKGVRLALLNLHNVLKENEKCNGPVSDNSNSCSPSSLKQKLLPFFHPQFQDSGFDREEMVWMWMCRNPSSAWVTAHCTYPEFIELRTFDLFSVLHINYQATTKVALVRLKITRSEQDQDGFYHTSSHFEDLQMKKDSDGKFKLFGNRRSFKYKVDTESKIVTTHTKHDPDNLVSGGISHEFRASLNFWLDKAHGLQNPQESTFTLTALSGNKIFPGDSTTAYFYLVRFASYSTNSCTQKWMLSTTPTPIESTLTIDNPFSPNSYHSEECLNTGDVCNCSSPDIRNYRQYQRMELSTQQLSRMNRIERIRVVNTTLGVDDEILITRPFILNSLNVQKFLPVISNSFESYCANPNATLELSLASGYLNHVTSTVLAIDEQENFSASKDLNQMAPETNVYEYSHGLILNQGQELGKNSYIDIEGRDQFDRRVSRKIICQ